MRPVELGRRPVALGWLAGVVALTLMSWVSSGWACIPQPKLVSLQPQASGPAGSRVTVQGLGFDQGPIEIRWNGSDGPQLAKAEGPNFSAEITIPSSPEGLYGVVVLGRKVDGAVGNTGTAAFQVSSRRAQNGQGAQNPLDATEALGDGREADRSTRAANTSLAALVAAFCAGAAVLALGGLGGVLLSRRWRATG